MKNMMKSSTISCVKKVGLVSLVYLSLSNLADIKAGTLNHSMPMLEMLLFLLHRKPTYLPVKTVQMRKQRLKVV